MADVVNLRRARKAHDRAIAQDAAATNRVLHGRTLAEKRADRLAKERAARVIDGAKLKE